MLHPSRVLFLVVPAKRVSFSSLLLLVLIQVDPAKFCYCFCYCFRQLKVTEISINIVSTGTANYPGHFSGARDGLTGSILIVTVAMAGRRSPAPKKEESDDEDDKENTA